MLFSLKIIDCSPFIPFSQACVKNSVHRRGVCLSACWDTSSQADTPRADTPLGRQPPTHPLPPPADGYCSEQIFIWQVNYRASTKLGKVNVFNRVSLLVILFTGVYRAPAPPPLPPLDMFNLDLTVQGPRSGHVQTCSLCSSYCCHATGWHSTEVPSCFAGCLEKVRNLTLFIWRGERLKIPSPTLNKTTSMPSVTGNVQNCFTTNGIN